MNFYIIPGNPPAVHFYELWKRDLKTCAQGAVMQVSPYPSFERKQDSHDYLRRVIDFHGEALLTFRKSVDGPITLIGHSIGGFVALELMQKHAGLIDHCLLLHPFLGKPGSRGTFQLQIINYLHRLAFLEKSLLKLRAVLEKIIPEFKFLTDEELKAFLNLAFHEYNVFVRNRKPLQIKSSLTPKIHLFYCDEDTWCQPETVSALQKKISHKKMAASHGFITSPQERLVMSEAIGEYLRKQNLKLGLQPSL